MILPLDRTRAYPIRKDWKTVKTKYGQVPYLEIRISPRLLDVVMEMHKFMCKGPSFINSVGMFDECRWANWAALDLDCEFSELIVGDGWLMFASQMGDMKCSSTCQDIGMFCRNGYKEMEKENNEKIYKPE